MDVHSAPVAARRMWGYLRAVFFMMRKGKRKLLLGAHLLIKRRNKAVSRSVASLLSHHHAGGRALRRREYEFSCSDSPDPGSFSMRRLAFPCLGAADDDVDLPGRLHAAPATPPRHLIEYYAHAAAAASPGTSSPGALMAREESELALGDDEECTPAGMSPLVPGAADGGFSVRVSNFSADEVDGDQLGLGEAVDDEAEEFIARFYAQLRRQNHVALLPYNLQEAAA
ncbi:hypothetical protein D1007_23146 [Hordeum vulgare]|nr:hypothetical protein D1007_23146 [Hordeum vulgare]